MNTTSTKHESAYPVGAYTELVLQKIYFFYTSSDQDGVVIQLDHAVLDQTFR